MDKNIFPKIIFPLLVFTLLFFFFVLVYNHNKEVKAQEEVGLVCDEEEIPIGEALEEARKLASAITGNSQAMFNSALSQIEAAKDLLDLADQCSADNCESGGCELVFLEPVKNFAGNIFRDDAVASNICPSYLTSGQVAASYSYSSSNPNLVNYQLAQADAPSDPPPNFRVLDEDDQPLPGCYDTDTYIVHFKWDSASDATGYKFRLTGSDGFDSGVHDLGNTFGVGWGNRKVDVNYTAEVWGYNVVGDGPMASLSFEVPSCGPDCEVLPCSGNPCPPEIVGKALTIGLAYLQIENSKKAIEDVIANRDDILDKLKEARKELEKCVTPAGELTEAEAREARTLIPCHEIKLQGALPGDKEDCDNPNNFYCCQFE